MRLHTMKLWGDYPALVADEAFLGITNIFLGMACLVTSEEEEDRLAVYETRMYRRRGCAMRISDEGQQQHDQQQEQRQRQDGGKEEYDITACTFVWDADPGVLRDGEWDFRDCIYGRERGTREQLLMFYSDGYPR